MIRKYLTVLFGFCLCSSLLVGCKIKSKNEQTIVNTTNNTETTTNNQDETIDPDSSNTAIKDLISATDGIVELKVLVPNSEGYKSAVENLVDRFAEEYADVDFDIEVENVDQVMDSSFFENEENKADIFIFSDNQINDLMKSNLLKDVSVNYIYNPSETNQEASVSTATIDGKLYAYPLTASNGYLLFYNSEYLTEEDCASWDGILSKANGIGKKAGVDLSNGRYVYGFFEGNGCTYSKQSDDSVECTWNSEAGIKTGNAIRNLYKNPAFVSIGEEAAFEMAENDELIAYVSTISSVDAFMNSLGDGYAASKLPTFNCDGSQIQMASIAGYNYVGVNSKSENTDWAMFLSEYISSESGQEIIAKDTGEGPANSIAMQKVASPALDALLEQSAFANANSQELDDDFFKKAGILGERITNGNEDVKKLLDDAVLKFKTK